MQLVLKSGLKDEMGDVVRRSARIDASCGGLCAVEISFRCKGGGGE